MKQAKLLFLLIAALAFASCRHGSRGDRHLGYSSRHTQVPVPATKKQLLSSKRRARSLEEMREKLLSSFENQISVEVYTLPKYKDYCANAKCLHNKIKSHLDLGLPVQISYFFPNEMLGHSVVVIGYSFCESVIHLYCLDPSIRMVHTTIWNNVIDLNLNYNNSNRMDYDHMAERKDGDITYKETTFGKTITPIRRKRNRHD